MCHRDEAPQETVPSTDPTASGPAEPPIGGRPIAWAFRFHTTVMIACPYGCGRVHEHGLRVACHGACHIDHEHLPIEAGFRSVSAPLHPWLPPGSEYVLVRGEPFQLMNEIKLHWRATDIAHVLGLPYRGGLWTPGAAA